MCNVALRTHEQVTTSDIDGRIAAMPQQVDDAKSYSSCGVSQETPNG